MILFKVEISSPTWVMQPMRDEGRREGGRNGRKDNFFFLKKCVVEELQLLLVLEWVATQGNVLQLFTKFES